MPLVAIQSVSFPNAFLRMDGSHVTQFEGRGSGTVNCQFYDKGSTPAPNIGNLEVFDLIWLPSAPPAGQGAGDFALRSFTYPNAFLRMDASNVTHVDGSVGGTVNCQYYPSGSTPLNNSSDLEYFKFLDVSSDAPWGNNAFSWGLNPFVWLRVDGSNVTRFEGGGSGTVNCQYGNWEGLGTFTVITL
jgi:hypothetical protein